MTVEKTARRRPALGGYSRGDEVRLRMVLAGLELFGAEGFEGASTRAIAERAEVKLPAFQYYFGGKEGLYLACAEHIARRLEEKLRPAVDRIGRMLSGNPAAGESLEALQLLLENFADTLVGGREPDSWVMFIMREQARPTAAFDLIYNRIMGPLTEMCTVLTGLVMHRSPRETEVRVRAFSLVGQVLAFRAARGTALRSLRWPDFDGRRMNILKRALREQTAAAFSKPAEARVPGSSGSRKG